MACTEVAESRSSIDKSASSVILVFSCPLNCPVYYTGHFLHMLLWMQLFWPRTQIWSCAFVRWRFRELFFQGKMYVVKSPRAFFIASKVSDLYGIPVEVVFSFSLFTFIVGVHTFRFRMRHGGYALFCKLLWRPRSFLRSLLSFYTFSDLVAN